MPQRATVHPVPHLPRSEVRALAYLILNGNDDVNVAHVLNRIVAAKYQAAIDERTNVLGRFRHWLAGGELHEYHHGWEKDSEFSMGYVFRWDHQRQHRRLYGFLTTPRPRFEVCVLCCFKPKDEERTDPAVKRTIIEASRNPAVNEAVRRAFNRGRWKS